MSGDGGWWPLMLPPLMTSLTFVGVAWWVNTEIRKKQDASSLIGASLEEIQRVVRRTIADVFEAETEAKCTALLRVLTNEVTHLQTLYESLAHQRDAGGRTKAAETGEAAVRDVNLAVLQLKGKMTDAWKPPDSEERPSAYEEAARVRHSFLEASLKVAKLGAR